LEFLQKQHILEKKRKNPSTDTLMPFNYSFLHYYTGLNTLSWNNWTANMEYSRNLSFWSKATWTSILRYPQRNLMNLAYLMLSRARLSYLTAYFSLSSTVSAQFSLHFNLQKEQFFRSHWINIHRPHDQSQAQHTRGELSTPDAKGNVIATKIGRTLILNTEEEQVVCH
jgi:hypothetical protein